MIVWHVTTLKKYQKYRNEGFILPPVRAWKDIISAGNFAIQTGRKIILRLSFPDNAEQLEGHKGNAVVLNEKFQLPKDLL